MNNNNDVQIGEIVGYRYWKVPSSSYCLRSLWQSQARWIPGIPMKGDITAADKVSMVGPKAGWHMRGPTCMRGCEGVHAYCDLSSLYEDIWNHHYPKATAWGKNGVFIIAGEVELWGQVDEHKRGYRASYGYPKAFYTNYFRFISKEYYDMLQRVANEYKVELKDIEHPIKFPEI